MICATTKVDDGSGSYFVINESDFDAKKHTLFCENAAMTAGELRAALDAKNVSYKTNTSKAELQALLDSAK